MQGKDSEIPVAGSSESVIERALKDFDVDSFKAAFEKSKPLGKRANAILELYEEKNVIRDSRSIVNLLLELSHHRPLDSRQAITGLACLAGVWGVFKTGINPTKNYVALAPIAAILYVVYDVFVYDIERKQKVKELKELENQLKSKEDKVDAIIKLVKPHSETNN